MADTHPGVFTFESGPQGAVLLARHPTLAASSSALPEGAYTTLRTYGGRRLFRLDRHLDRLSESVALQGRPAPLDRALGRRSIRDALETAGFEEARLRLTFAPPSLFVAVESFSPLHATAYADGVACVTVDVVRDNPLAKDTRFIATAQDVYGHLPEGVEEALLVAEDGSVLEGLSSNFFAVRDGRLHTEDARALHGITRSAILEVAGALLPVDLQAIPRGELARASETFITSVSREVLPVVRIDGRPVGDGRVGGVTRAIILGVADLVAREAEEP
ncbi:MAG TPA: aminotransferase class IV [Vicinamibacteria bacterium]|nr:aminotransferase class IV [Vicinamibacteria bacterium]